VADGLGVAVGHDFCVDVKDEFGVAAPDEFGVTGVITAEDTGTGDVPDEPPLQPALAPARAKSNNFTDLFMINAPPDIRPRPLSKEMYRFLSEV
jgi:hypothetical protein